MVVGFTSVSSTKPLPKIREETVPEYLLERAKHFLKEGREAFLENGLTGERLTFKNFDNETLRVASCFYKRGLRKGDIVVYMTSHQLPQIVMMMGVWRANGVVRSLYVDESEETILEKIKESNSRWIFCDAENAPKCQSIADKVGWTVEIVVCGEGADGFQNFAEFYKDNGKSAPKFEMTGDDMAIILPTSGTTGPSKGAWHSHKGLVHDIRQWAGFPFMQHKPNLIASKGTHVSGALLPFAMLVRGVLGVVLAKMSKEIIIQTVDKYKPGVVFAFPSFLLSLGSSDADGYDVTSVETIFTGGSPTTEEMHKAFMAITNVKLVMIAFGLTEGPCVSTTADMRETGAHEAYKNIPAGTVGKPYPGGQLQIRDLDTMEVLGPNQRGEIVARGDYIFQGYYKNPESTKNAFIDGWFRTGDVGYLNDDGFLFIVDRAKDIFKYFHNHISPTELEGVIQLHPEVKEVCVFPVPDEGGEVPRAFVTLMNHKNGKSLAQLATEIKTFADGKLATYKQLKGGLYIVEDFPKGKTGKVVRTMVGQMPLPTY
ncbi:4-coumarate--CoA ligase 1 [Folsomia candida]|uniref:4-coumarate--CoA ligase 1 n=1 Tax=Folsomia candida TaxID=158441 RepID=UPI0016055D7D|nr:4-coumarate--CoA ligase 1 [Folsomia candida]